jgi:hypothetical protein
VQSWHAQVQFTFTKQIEWNFYFIIYIYIYIYMCVCVCVCVCVKIISCINVMVKVIGSQPLSLQAVLHDTFIIRKCLKVNIKNIYALKDFIFLVESCFLFACSRNGKDIPIPSQFIAVHEVGHDLFLPHHFWFITRPTIWRFWFCPSCRQHH